MKLLMPCFMFKLGGQDPLSKECRSTVLSLSSEIISIFIGPGCRMTPGRML